MIMAVMLRVKINNIRILDMINEKIYDQKLITIEDYSVVMAVTPTMRQKFREVFDDIDEDTSETLLFEQDLTEQIER